ncbi:acetyl/propionyl/methylcrotonyl-CoA carboxylase subunit alpha [Variovorax sp. PBL-E5]|uniref:acetyl/propionyl/methylcrotonyl-CoA carboxylase subunit alpha n=1 Tax=Variovorax sp. PBL-E5 TaxID=434014 RepID=UPI001316D4AB|nr:acetyl-CoA carboxylase biotin carboxylase subunit [Variovorax sp. PBL-E5]VTU23073.1 Acetyl-/propionyl-coenzyme A carboxylase alpha chain [Variovorax sp. PBL-E5]
MSSPTPFSKILIANRGEIALRIMRTARQLGYRCVAVYSHADADARHVREADQAVCVGDSLPAQSYLNIPALIDAARLTGADAVHPGYGFLAENEAFAQACVDAGLVFIGPSAEAIRAMGSKARAKLLMEQAGVPCIPGYQGEDQSERQLMAEAQRVGFPVMIKASAGGGGRGMRLVQTPGDFPELLRSAQSEAKNAFGDAQVILERAIVQPRHIEIQILADRFGHAIHLGERDCSVQRRHQKLIEEAPSPAVDAELRQRMGEVAVKAVQAIRYEGAGTLEFLLDPSGAFYFMEMNTRLQVEHPVTEAITGLDLVELQLRIAAGEALPLSQAQVQFKGHAMEVRICTEDPSRAFMPQSGTMSLWEPTRRLRVDHALASGCAIPPFYDSMIAKVVSHGIDRDEARRKLATGLEDCVALGVQTNKAFLGRCLTHPVFAAGRASTAFIAEHLDALLVSTDDELARAQAVGALLMLETSAGASRRAGTRQLGSSLPIELRLDFGGRAAGALFHATGEHAYELQIDGRSHKMSVNEIEEHSLQVLCDGILERVFFHRDGARLLFEYRGQAHEVLDATRAATIRKEDEAGTDGGLRASMNGRVIAVLAQVGDKVRAGQPIITLEAMKMEHAHGAPVAGTVTAVHAAVGDHVPARRMLAEITADAPVVSANGSP